MAVVGTTVYRVWDLASKAGGPWTGLSATMTTTLRRTDGATITTATETVTKSEIDDGLYLFSYTPENAETYTLFVVESATGWDTQFEDTASATSTTGTLSYSFAIVSDVEAIVQHGSFGASTQPTEAQVQFFLVNRSADIYGYMRGIGGTDTPGPSGYNVTIDTSSDEGYALDRACRNAAAFKASVDTLQAAGANTSPGRSERMAELEVLYERELERIGDLVRSYLFDGTTSENHISSGDSTAASITSQEENGWEFDMNSAT